MKSLKRCTYNGTHFGGIDSMIKVNYAVVTKYNEQTSIPALDLMMPDVVNAFQYISDYRPSDTEYFKCPAFLEYCKNAYFVLSPYDLTFRLGSNNYLSTTFHQKLNQITVNNRPSINTISLPPHIVFWAEDDLVMESSPVFLNQNTNMDLLRLIVGKYNIHKWVRPCDFSFEILERDVDITIKHGDPLFCVKFATDEKVKLVRQDYTDKLFEVVTACTEVKQVSRDWSLNQLYETAGAYLKRKGILKSCPFKKK